MRAKLGELLLQENMVTPQQLQEALSHQKMNGGRLGTAFVTRGFLKDEEITGLLSRKYGIRTIELANFALDPAIIKIIPAETARKYKVLPLSRSDKTLRLGMADPTNVVAVDDIEFMTGCRIEPLLVSEAALEDAIERYYGSMRPLERRRDAGGAGEGGGNSLKEVLDTPGLTMEDMASVGLSEVDLDSISDAVADVEQMKEADDEIDLGNLSKSADATPVVKLVNVLLIDSLKRGASDIHIEPYEKDFRVRFRIDGVLYNVMALPMKLRVALASRIKAMARLDTKQDRLPQSGRIKIKMKIGDRGRDLAFRVSCLPTLWGEKIVMRLLDKSKLMLDMTKLGFEPNSLERFKKAVANRYGIVLVTGPTGSGKTTTLYSAIASLNTPDTNIMTAENVVELNLPGINQVQVNPGIGLSFSAVLRSFPRQDSNIIMVDDIDGDRTAEAVVRAARRGPLVIAAIDDLDSISAALRLAQARRQPFLLTATPTLVVAQCLIRRVCANCKVEITDMPGKTLFEIGVPPDQVGGFKLYKGKGCGTCYGTGYKGRVGLYEVMEVSEGIRNLVMVGATAVEIKRKALEEGMLTLRMSGVEKIKAGITTVEEVLRETVL